MTKKHHILASSFYLLLFLLLPQLGFAVEAKLQIPIPGFQPSETLAKPNPETGVITTDLLPQYIAALYSYLVGFASLFATSLIMYGGMKWIFAAGDSGKISKAKEVISHAMIGLAIALGSYLILFTLNPKLVNFEALKLISIKRELVQEVDEGDPLEEGAARPPGVSEPTWTHATFNCANPPPEAGVIPESTTVPIPREFSKIGTSANIRVHTSMLPGLQKLNAALETFSQNDGVNYLIGIGSGYRPYNSQVRLWCGPESNCFRSYENTAVRKGFCAVPGFSNHGQGYAVDVSLFRNGEKITAGNSQTQCTINKTENVAKLADIFYAADPGWVRYEAEIWHFEFNPTETSQRGKYRDLPAKCR